MTPHATLRLPSGRTVDLPPGGIVGRMASATARIQDPRVSEAHALVSLRGRELRLLALRGRLRVDGQEDDDVILAPGQQIELTEGVRVEVVAIEVPDHVLAVELGTLAPLELAAATYSVVVAPHVDLVPGFVPDAPALIWNSGEDWTLRIGAERPEVIRAGRSWTVAGHALRASMVPIAAAGSEITLTRGDHGMTVVLRYPSVHLQRPRRHPLVLDGLPARLVCELAEMGVPAEWTVVARQLWPDEDDTTRLRQGWDRALRRLRSRLREGGVREDLVRPDGCGNVELLLLPGDRVIIDDG